MTETELQTYFEQLKQRYNLPNDMTLTWIPSNECKYHGMTSKDLKSIFVFDEDLEMAKRTLRHECLEVILTSVALVLADPELSRDEKYEIKEQIIGTIQNFDDRVKHYLDSKQEDLEKTIYPLLKEHDLFEQVQVGDKTVGRVKAQYKQGELTKETEEERRESLQELKKIFEVEE